MNSSTLRRTGGIAAAALSLSLGLAACGSSSSTDATATDTTAAVTPTSSAPAPSSSAPTTSTKKIKTFGKGCSSVAKTGAGSFKGMVSDPVATAASNNKLLSTLVTAVGVAGLGDTLNTTPNLTVFAPDNDAFAAIPPATLKAVLADKATLTKILTYHVIPKELNPKQIIGTQKTLEGGTVKVTGSTKGMKVNGVPVLCGNVPTMNATVYILGSVLMPPK